jgi:hypothetical protein
MLPSVKGAFLVFPTLAGLLRLIMNQPVGGVKA